MNRNIFSILSVLLLGCAEPQPVQNNTLPQTPVTVQPSGENSAGLEETVKEESAREEAKREAARKRNEGIFACKIDLSNRFIPELLAGSINAEKYFSSQGIFSDPLQRERFGLFYTFEPYPEMMKHYIAAMEKRGDEATPELNFRLSRDYYFTNPATLNKIAELKGKEKRSKNEDTLLKALEEKVARVKEVQKILSWEEFYTGAIDGDYSATQGAMRKYQQFNKIVVHGLLDIETKKKLTQPLELQAIYYHQRILRSLEERVFHAKCSIDGKEQYPYVIESKELAALVKSAAGQLGLDSFKGAARFFENNPSKAVVELKIPPRYLQEEMNLEIEVIKSKKERKKTSFALYAVENGEKVELFKRRAVVGGKNKVLGQWKEFDTPAGEANLKRIVVMPHWNPPSWSKEKYGHVSTLPGPLNAYGTFMAELYYSDEVPKDPYAWYMDGDRGFRLHLTANPFSLECGCGKSHGCVRLHPGDGSRFFYFALRYTPHEEMKELFKKGEIVPFVPGRFIGVKIRE